MQRFFIIFVCAVTALIVGALLVLAGFTAATPAHFLGLLIGFFGLTLLSYLAVHATRFYRDLSRLIRRLTDGKYDSGMTAESHGRDELTRLRRRVNRMVDQLRAYDELRARRVRATQRVLETVVQNVEEPLLIIGGREGTVELNSAASRLLNSTQSSLSMNALKNIGVNAAFFKLLAKATEKEETAQQGTVPLQLPAREAPEQITVRILPVRVAGEGVRAVVIISPNSQTGPTELEARE